MTKIRACELPSECIVTRGNVVTVEQYEAHRELAARFSPEQAGELGLMFNGDGWDTPNGHRNNNL